MPLLTALKRRLTPATQWIPIALGFPQPVVTVRLVAGGQQFDVTANNVITALNPMMVSIGLDTPLRSALELTPAAQLHFVDRERDRLLGVLHLRFAGHWNVAEVQLGVFDVVSGAHFCTSRLAQAWEGWKYRRAERRRSQPDSLGLSPQMVEQTMVFYLCPRPVFLVSVSDRENSNLFPMDLVGPVLPDHFSLALRNTSPSVQTIKNARTLALSSVPAGYVKVAYQLGAHHKRTTIDFASLPFKTALSTQFSLPVPQEAPRVREIEILDHRSNGSHTQFLGRVVSDAGAGSDHLLFHTSGIHQQYRTRHKSAFQVA